MDLPSAAIHTIVLELYEGRPMKREYWFNVYLDLTTGKQFEGAMEFGSRDDADWVAERAPNSLRRLYCVHVAF
jgi:hypothetical protein